MNIPFEEAWRWLKSAPLPVVVAVTLALATWLYAVDTENKVQSEQVKAAKDTAEKTDKKVDRIEDKVDKLLEVVLELKAEKKAAEPKPSPKPQEK